MDKPIVLACSGCSFAGKLSYDLARELDRRGIAEMSCLAGVAAQRPSFQNKVASRKLWLLDGCAIACGACLYERLERKPDVYIRLDQFGIKKNAAPVNGVDMDALVGWVCKYAGVATHHARA